MNDTVIINEQALGATADTLRSYITSLAAAFNDAAKDLSALGGEWNDEDYSEFINSISSFSSDINGLSAAAGQLLGRIEKRLEAIRQLHAMKIGG